MKWALSCALDWLADLRDMLSDWKSDIDKSDDIQCALAFLKKAFRVIRVRGGVGIRMLWGTGLGLFAVLAIITAVIPFPSFHNAEEAKTEEQEIEQSFVEQSFDNNNGLTAKAKTNRSTEKKEREPINWDAVIGFVVVAFMANVVCAITFWRKDRKKVTPETIKKRLKEADDAHRERRRNIMFDLFRSQGLNLKEVKNTNQLADDVSAEMEESNGDMEQ